MQQDIGQTRDYLFIIQLGGKWDIVDVRSLHAAKETTLRFNKVGMPSVNDVAARLSDQIYQGHRGGVELGEEYNQGIFKKIIQEIST